MKFQQHRKIDESVDFSQQHADNAQANVAFDGLCHGLTLLRDFMVQRIYDDVERSFGVDSTLVGGARDSTRMRMGREIDLFQVVVSADETWRTGYVPQGDSWYLHRLTRLRLGDAADEANMQQLVDRSLLQSAADRRLDFGDRLVDVFPESRLAPLVLLRLFPLSVRIVTAIAFDDALRAGELRNQQHAFLPVIADCRQCEAAILDNGEHCVTCGNPLWKFEWLTSVD